VKYLVFLFFFISLGSFSAEQPYRSIEYLQINSMIDLLQNKVRSPYVRYQAQLIIDDPSVEPSSIKIWLTENGKHLQDIAINHQTTTQEYRLNLPLFEKTRAQHIHLNINQDKESVGIAVTTDLMIPQEKVVHYNDLMVVLDDINEFAGEMAGAWSWMMPDMDQLKFVFASNATITLKTTNNPTVLHTNKDFEIVLKNSRKLRRLNPLVEFSISPKAMIPED
jgi:hypothetical protein